MLRVVLDTNVFVSAAIARGNPLEIVERWMKNGDFEIVISREIIQELRIVLLERPRLRRWISTDDAQEFLEVVSTLAVLTDFDAGVEVEVRDPKDEHVLKLAASSGANLIVTGDIDLVTAHSPAVMVLTPAQFLAHLGEPGHR